MGNRSKINFNYIFYGFYFLQTPVFKGKEEDRIGDIKRLLSDIVHSEVFAIIFVAIVVAIGLYILYNRKKAMPELEMQLIKEDTWFATRDDNRRTAIIVSVEITNKATYGLYITNCKLSGYSPKEHPEEICLDDLKGENKLKLNLPQYKHFCKGQDFYIGPYSSEKLWFYYESRAMTMANLLETSISLRDSRNKRKSMRINIIRHSNQIAQYQEMANMW
ncbi:MAG: hypothetical protein ACPL7B_10425 [Candidatus Poribacteria bacterium]